MTDNSAALRRSRRLDSSTKRRRAEEVLSAMEQAGDPITFAGLARRAGVSVSLLYAHSNLSARIATARDRQRQSGTDRSWRLPPRSLVTEQGLRTDLANAKERARRLAEEVGLLRAQLGRQLGAFADCARDDDVGSSKDQLEKRCGELEADNHQQFRRITELEAETRDLTETLAAGRAINRELMSELNRT